jgi:uncharacterized protein
LNFYLDTSLLIAALTVEPESGRAQQWLQRQGDGSLSISLWVIAEFASALSIKQRTGQIADEERATTLALFRRLSTDTLTTLRISDLHFRTAARFVEQPPLGLRAPDGLHLAICSDYGGTLCTLDRRLAEAGTVLGVKTLLV